MNQPQMSSPNNEASEKHPWNPPALEELDFSATEAAYIPGAPNDLGMYSI